MIVADTGAILALVDADDQHHGALRTLFEANAGDWVLPWAILPEIDYILSEHVSRNVERAFLADLAEGAFAIEWGQEADLRRAREIDAKYQKLGLGLVDCVVIAVAERLRAEAIATTDNRHFGAVAIRGRPKLLPRDVEA